MSESVSTRPLLDKLGVRPGARVALDGIDDPVFRDLLSERTADVTDGLARPGTDLVFLAAEHRGDLARIAEQRSQITPAGAIWVVSRKGRSATLRDIDVIAAAASMGLVDNKVVAFSDSHTALRLVIPRTLRPR